MNYTNYLWIRIYEIQKDTEWKIKTGWEGGKTMSKIDDFKKKQVIVNRAAEQFKRCLEPKSKITINWTSERDHNLNIGFCFRWEEGEEFKFVTADDSARFLAKAILNKMPELIDDILIIANNELTEAEVEAKKEALSFLGDVLTIGDQGSK